MLGISHWPHVASLGASGFQRHSVTTHWLHWAWEWLWPQSPKAGRARAFPRTMVSVGEASSSESGYPLRLVMTVSSLTLFSHSIQEALLPDVRCPPPRVLETMAGGLNVAHHLFLQIEAY